jgi:hypothetical protein
MKYLLLILLFISCNQYELERKCFKGVIYERYKHEDIWLKREDTLPCKISQQFEEQEK